jgi:hypothetical protein
MLNAVPEILGEIHPSEAEARFYSSSEVDVKAFAEVRLHIEGRIQSDDPTSGFEIRIGRSAWSQMEGHIDGSRWESCGLMNSVGRRLTAFSHLPSLYAERKGLVNFTKSGVAHRWVLSGI